MAKRQEGLNVSPDLRLPLDAVTQTFALLAIRRAGKSNAGAVMAEEMFDAELPWVAIDPKGDWWGLRSNAAGDGPGLPIPIFGGLHADMPLNPESGRLMAELIVEHNLTCILDVSRFSKAARIRFLTDFALRLYELHQADPQPRHIFLEEADRVLPQRVMQDMAACVGAFTDLIRYGGSFGLGITIISQRSAVINKDGLTQVETMIPLRTTSPQDRKAIRDWMEHHAIAPEIVESLPSLVSGEAWVSSSYWLTQYDLPAIQKIRFRQRRTFDSGATPKVGQQRRVATLADIDLGALAERMADVVEKAAQDDPKALRKQIADLKRQLASAAPADSAALAQAQRDKETLRGQLAEALARPAERVEVPAFQMSDLEHLRDLATSLSESLGTVRVAVDAVLATETPQPVPAAPVQLGGALMGPPIGQFRPKPVAQPTIRNIEPAEQASDDSAAEPPAALPGLKAGARNMLDVLGRQHPMRITRAQLAALTRIKVTGSTFSTYMGQLRRAGLISEEGGYVLLTDDGLAASGADTTTPMDPAELRAMWDRVLKLGARNMLDMLIDAHPDTVTRDELAEQLGIDVAGSTFSTYLGTLRRNGLADESSDGVRAADVFFLGGSNA